MSPPCDDIPFTSNIGSTATQKLKAPAMILYPITEGAEQVPNDLVEFLHAERNAEISRGTMYSGESLVDQQEFASEWFEKFAVIAVQEEGAEQVGIREGRNWANTFLGTFNIKPHYPGRCSHICRAEFIINDALQSRDLKKALGEAYLDYAMKLGYKYAMFNLVFSNDICSIGIWKELGFGEIGRIPMSAQLENREELVEAFVLGKELNN